MVSYYHSYTVSNIHIFLMVKTCQYSFNIIQPHDGRRDRLFRPEAALLGGTGRELNRVQGQFQWWMMRI